MSTTTFVVVDGDDDAVENDDGSGFSATSSAPIVFADTTASTRSNVGIRFDQSSVATDKRIPQYARILSARLDLNVGSAKWDDPTLTIFGHAHDASPDFASSADVTSRATTTASAAWSATDLGTGVKSSPDLTTIVQEIVDRAGYSDGAAITLLLKGNNAASGDLIVSLFESGIPPALVVEWELTPRVMASGTKDAAGNTAWDLDSADLAGSLSGDWLFMFSALATQTATLTPPTTNATWALVAGPESSSAHRVYVHARKRLATETSETWTRSAGALSQICVAVRNFDAAASTVHYSADLDNGASGTDATPPTAALANALAGDLDIIVGTTDDRASTTTAVPAGFAKHAEIVTGSRCQMVVGSKRVATTGMQASVDLTFGAADQWITGRLGIRRSDHATIGGTAIATDTFDRADSTTGLGISDSGHTWVDEVSSVWGIGTNRAYVVSDDPGSQRAYTLLDLAADGTLEVTITDLSTVNAGVLFRVKTTGDTADYWRVHNRGDGAGLALQSVVAGSIVTSLLDASAAMVNGDIVRVSFLGPAIVVHRNNDLVFAISDATHADGTRHGLYAMDVGPEFDNLTFYGTAIVIPLLNAAPALYQPGVTQGSQSVVVPLLDGTPTLHEPDVVQHVGVPALVSSVLYAPAVEIVVVVPTLNTATTLHEPGVAAAVTVPVLDAAPTVLGPALAQHVAVPFIESMTLHEPTITATTPITVPSLDATAVLHEPAVAYRVALPLLAAGILLPAPGIRYELAVPLLEAGPALPSPAVRYVVALELLVATPSLHQPGVTIGAVTIEVPLLAATTVYAPGVVGASTPDLTPIRVTYQEIAHVAFSEHGRAAHRQQTHVTHAEQARGRYGEQTHVNYGSD